MNYLAFMDKWTPMGQACFLLLVLSAVIGAIGAGFRYLAIMVRGWPPPEVYYRQGVDNDDDEDDDEDDD